LPADPLGLDLSARMGTWSRVTVVSVVGRPS
jgi:hypothetical protein